MFSDKGFDYYTVFHRMTMDEVDEAVAALGLYSEAVKRNTRKIR